MKINEYGEFVPDKNRPKRKLDSEEKAFHEYTKPERVKMSKNFEKIYLGVKGKKKHEVVYRLMVPGGWLVATDIYKEDSDMLELDISVFVPDPEHKWRPGLDPHGEKEKIPERENPKEPAYKLGTNQIQEISHTQPWKIRLNYGYITEVGDIIHVYGRPCKVLHVVNSRVIEVEGL